MSDEDARRCLFVDVFTDVATRGNPLAVVLDGEGLATAEMQAFARFTNLSETTFVTAPTVEGADYRLRIFTPSSELPFAGHPTVGSAHAVATEGVVVPVGGRMVQQCDAGLVPITIAPDGAVQASAPRAEILDVEVDGDALSAALGDVQVVGPALVVDAGPKWLTARLADGDAVRAAVPSMADLERLYLAIGATGVNIYGFDDDSGPEVRSFAPADGIPEDPVCGSGNVSVAAHLRATGEGARVTAGYVARQGRCIGRDGYVCVGEDADGRITIGGHAVTVVTGELRL
jgi:PhzF family phenazine biosynthesis protein